MPLDPSVRRIIEEFNKVKPQMSKVPLNELRRMSRASSLSQPKRQIHKVFDISIPGSEVKIPARVYVPRDGEDFGVLVYYHGGGFVFGDVESYDPLCRELAVACDCVVVSVDYRLAPENKFPAAVVDAFDSVQWVLEHANEVNGDSEKIAVGGDSAGGNLAAVVAIMARDKGLRPSLKYQVLVNPFVGVDVASYSIREYSMGFLLDRDDMDFFNKAYLSNLTDALDPRFSPILVNDLSNLPPALIITSEYDPLRDSAETYATRLSEAGVPTVVVRFNGVVHGFYNMPIPHAKVVVGLIGSTLRQAFYGKY
ncbi:alpha/beta hydrolase [Caldivirga maquilingensis]|uniref:Alpha/beta hydrolase fold-3 domain protein n=1 Tax=Caldivirga maquilingensis (strain ATCC 700844 / DSM 13496 / JCM 10307 / IC-167) TaxID=397948 RepID=A8MDF9_CALMQ|nr:alpha/beta hydrolase [Caldivirga maquilingensis]ABW01815.1 Alpha/beta hydrolase fold-3 domain protein [Caldivirga maquilingensis IC-167]